MTDTAVQKSASIPAVNVGARDAALVVARFLLAKEFMRHDVFARIFPFVMRWMNNPTLVGRLLLFGRALIALPFLADAVKKVIFLQQEMAFFGTGGRPGSAIYLVILVEIIFGLGLLFGYRARLCGAVLFVWACILGFVLHNPNLSLFGGDFGTFMFNLFEKNGGNLMSFEKDIDSLGALLMVMICGPGPVSLDARRSAEGGS